MRKLLISSVLFFLGSTLLWPQAKLSTHWEELTAADFRSAIQQSQGTCLLPFGILEKHGPHLPLGTDLLDVRYATLHAADQEYAVVLGIQCQGLRARNRLQRLFHNEFRRADFFDDAQRSVGHGGNESLLPFFAQSQMEKPHDYVAYILGLVETPPGGPAKKTKIDMHAGESETSKMLISRPDLVHLDRAASESGADLARLKLPENVYTGIWWYARFPNHYSGEGVAANKELGQFEMNGWIDGIVKAIKAVKADDQSLKIQNEFYEKSKHPLDTRP